MKKIVALVLSLALVLALGTVAFAADKVFFGEQIGGTAIVESSSTQNVTLEKFTTGAAAAKTPDTYKVWKTTVATGAKEQVSEFAFVLTDENNADFVFVSGNTITYLMVSPTSGAATYEGVGTAVKTVAVEDKAKATCGDIVSDAALYTVEGKDGYFRAIDMTPRRSWMVIKVGDKLIRVVEADEGYDYEVIDHTMTTRSTSDGSKTTVTGLYCSTCKKEFSFVDGTEADAIAKFGLGNYAHVDGTGLYYAVAGAAAPAANGSNVTSAKTFDAGVAMYAGLALMSVAGSAVVIGKKKEF